MAMDARAVIAVLATAVSGAAPWLMAGAAIGAFHFLSLRTTAGMLAAPASFTAALTLHLLRFPVTAAALVVVARHGAAPLLAATLGVVAARTVVVTAAQRACADKPAAATLEAVAERAPATPRTERTPPP